MKFDTFRAPSWKKPNDAKEEKTHRKIGKLVKNIGRKN